METKSWNKIKNEIYGETGTERRDELDRDFASFKTTHSNRISKFSG
jgi:hypothetical protein